jgi:hypothetical protein
VGIPEGKETAWKTKEPLKSNIKWIFNRQGRRTWLRIGTNGGILGIR